MNMEDDDVQLNDEGLSDETLRYFSLGDRYQEIRQLTYQDAGDASGNFQSATETLQNAVDEIDEAWRKGDSENLPSLDEWTGWAYDRFGVQQTLPMPRLAMIHRHYELWAQRVTLLWVEMLRLKLASEDTFVNREVSERRDKIARIQQNMMKVKEFVISSVVARANTSGQILGVAEEGYVSIVPATCPPPKSMTSFQRCLRKLCIRLQEEGYRRVGESCYRPLYIDRHSRTPSHAYEFAIEIEKFVHQEVSINRDFELHLDSTASPENAAKLIYNLQTSTHPQFLDLKCRDDMFIFADGIYISSCDVFFPYDCRVNPNSDDVQVPWQQYADFVQLCRARAIIGIALRSRNLDTVERDRPYFDQDPDGNDITMDEDGTPLEPEMVTEYEYEARLLYDREVKMRWDVNISPPSREDVNIRVIPHPFNGTIRSPGPAIPPPRHAHPAWHIYRDSYLDEIEGEEDMSFFEFWAAHREFIDEYARLTTTLAGQVAPLVDDDANDADRGVADGSGASDLGDGDGDGDGEGDGDGDGDGAGAEAACKKRKRRVFDNSFYVNEISTPDVDKVFDDQSFTKESRTCVFIMLGRLLYPIGKKDGWQKLLFFLGRAGTGKSTMAKLIAYAFQKHEVGVFGNHIEPRFGWHPLCDKKLAICFEVKSGLEQMQADLQTAISGEEMSIGIKHKQAKTITWTVPIVMCGNEQAWKDSENAMRRRLFVAAFNNSIKSMDYGLFDRMKQDFGAFLRKINCLYCYAIDAKLSIDDVITKQLGEMSNAAYIQTNSLAGFLAEEADTWSSAAVDPSDPRPWDVISQRFYVLYEDLKEAFDTWRRENKPGEKIVLNKSLYQKVFEDEGITYDPKAPSKTLSYKGQMLTSNQFVIGVRLRLAMGMDVADGDGGNENQQPVQMQCDFDAGPFD